ncbi:MAG TPA: hypothetical protein VFC04_01775 [Actinomycetota bacterium]|jgi:hypothetical protein|nr:hypothetical protein [Actinomycetota bacterium]
MSILRRRPLPDALARALEGFRRTLEPLERAKRALTDSVPSTRLPGRPLAETLLEFEEGLRAARDRMPGWRTSELEGEWRACADAIETALAGAERLRLEAEVPEGFEALIGTVGDLLAPLDAFERAGDRLRAQARRARRARRA